MDSKTKILITRIANLDGIAKEVVDCVHTLGNVAADSANRRGELIRQQCRAISQGLIGAEAESVLASRCHRALVALPFLIVMVLGSWWLALYSFQMIPDPSLQYIAAAALVCGTILSMDLFLEACDRFAPLMISLSACALVAILAVHCVLSAARAHMITASIAEAREGTAVFAVGGQTSLDATDDLAGSLLPLLSIAMPLLALGMELLAGLVFYRIVKSVCDPALLGYRKVRRLEEKAIKAEYEAAEECAVAENAMAFTKLQWTLHQDRKNLLRQRWAAILAPAVLILILICSLRLHAETVGGNPDASCPGRVAHLVDLSLSRSPQDLAADIAAVEAGLSQSCLGSHHVVIGITADSWGSPQVLLDVRVGRDSGWMNRNLMAARVSILTAWRETARSLQPRYRGTDVFGALGLAARLLEIGHDVPGTIYVYSDLRQSARINLEHLQAVPADETLREVRSAGMLPDLRGARVLALGVSPAGRSECYWGSLRTFWVAFFKEAGANLVAYSIGRDGMALARGITPDRSATNYGDAKGHSDCSSDVPEHTAVVAGASVRGVSETATATVRIVSPAPLAFVDIEESVEGIISGPVRPVLIVVHPVRTGEYWCQGEAAVHAMRDGSSTTFSGTAIFGRPVPDDQGKVFQVRAIMNSVACHREGDVLSYWPQGEASPIVSVTRR